MKQFGTVYVPHDPNLHGVSMDGNHYVIHEGFMGPDSKYEVVPMRNSIVLTIEELREAIKDGYNEGKDAQKNDWEDFDGVFEQFLKRKDIKLPDNG